MDDAAAAADLARLSERPGETDPILRALTNTSGSGITLIVGGTLVSGTVCSAAEWFEEFGGMVQADSGDASDWTVVADRFRLVQVEAEEFNREMNERFDADPEAEFTTEERVKALGHERRFIHLSHAAVYAGGSRYPTEGGALWRGKMSSVDGFFPGSLGQS